MNTKRTLSKKWLALHCCSGCVWLLLLPRVREPENQRNANRCGVNACKTVTDYWSESLAQYIQNKTSSLTLCSKPTANERDNNTKKLSNTTLWSFALAPSVLMTCTCSILLHYICVWFNISDAHVIDIFTLIGVLIYLYHNHRSIMYTTPFSVWRALLFLSFTAKRR